MDKSLVEVMLQYGGLGVVVVVVAWAYWKERAESRAAAVAAAAELRKESDARISDAKASTEMLRDLTERAVTAVERDADVTEQLVRELRYERLGSEEPIPIPPPRYDPRRDPEPTGSLKRPVTGQAFDPRRRSNPDWNRER